MKRDLLPAGLCDSDERHYYVFKQAGTSPRSTRRGVQPPTLISLFFLPGEAVEPLRTVHGELQGLMHGHRKRTANILNRKMWSLEPCRERRIAVNVNDINR